MNRLAAVATLPILSGCGSVAHGFGWGVGLVTGVAVGALLAICLIAAVAAWLK